MKSVKSVYAIAVLLLPIQLAAPRPACAQTTARVSVNSSGFESKGESGEAAISRSGRYVAFRSRATNVVADDRNGEWDVFIHDRRNGETIRVSVDSSGGEANAASGRPSLSADGRYVAFESEASNLVPGDTNGRADVFVHDRRTGATTRVSVNSAGIEASLGGRAPAMSADARFVAFRTASSLAPADTNAMVDVYLHDRETSETTIVSVDSAGVPGDADVADHALSADGSCVAFTSASGRLVLSDDNGFADVFVHDRRTGETTRVSVDSSGFEASWLSDEPSISADGRVVAFTSAASGLVPDDGNRKRDVFVHDRLSGVTTRVSVDSAGTEASGPSDAPAISDDGRRVAFRSSAPNLVPGDTNGDADVFVHDRATGRTTRASVSRDGTQGTGESDGPAISADGRAAAFTSAAADLVPSDGNGARDVFVRVLVDCGSGSVNGGPGPIVNVLFVNGSAGGPDRTIRLLQDEPLTIFMGTPASSPASAPFALYAWAERPAAGERPFLLPFDLGETCLPTPLTGGSPAPSAIWNNTGFAGAGAPMLPSSPAPSIVLTRSRAFGRPADVYLQGIIRDRAAPNGRAAVTNGVAIEIR